MTAQQFYKLPGKLSDLSNYQDFVDWLSPEPRTIFQVVQGLLIHEAWIQRYGAEPSDNQISKVATPSANDLLSHALRLRDDHLSLAVSRSPEQRVMASCRELTLLATALFRAKGIPARARCGFALYLAYDGQYEDHWICEYWDGSEWIGIDPQIDPFQESTFQDYAISTDGISASYKAMLLSLDPLRVTPEHFINAGTAWKMYREGGADSNKFGIGADPKAYGLDSLYGAWFIRGQLLRDFAALNKVETVPFLVRLEAGKNWDAWRLVSTKDDELSEDDLKLLDTIAELCVQPDATIDQIQKLYADNNDLQALVN